jgi:NAD(P)-dependent dehydrogenase (short-subunit alcohol dehydrogenase family)
MSKVVVITGAARGLGEGMARRLSARGARLALLDRDAGPLEDVVAGCPGSRGWAVDVTNAAALAQVEAEVVDHFGGVDVLVVNAGIGSGGVFRFQDADEFERVIEVNLLGSIRTTRAFLPHLIARKGYLLQIASLAALVPAPMMTAYCASKSGIEAFAHCLRAELREHGVDVGVAYLGFTATDMVRIVDEDPVLSMMRNSMPGPFAVTRPLAPAVGRLVRGIEGRKAHVYSPGWLRALPLLRGAMPALVQRRAPSLAEAERLSQADWLRTQ